MFRLSFEIVINLSDYTTAICNKMISGKITTIILIEKYYQHSTEPNSTNYRNIKIILLVTVSWCNQVTVCINSITGTGKEKHNNQNKCGMTSAMSDVEMF